MSIWCCPARYLVITAFCSPERIVTLMPPCASLCERERKARVVSSCLARTELAGTLKCSSCELISAKQRGLPRLRIARTSQGTKKMMPPRKRHRGDSAKDAAEAAFKSVTRKPVETAPTVPKIPFAKELVSLRIDQDVLEFFQEGGPGWQERINEALRKAAGK